MSNLINPAAIPVVYYHSVGPLNPQWARNYLTLELPFFEDQLLYFKRNFSIIPLKTFYNIRAGLEKGPRNPLVLTFDDGFLDNWVWAFPLLKKYRLPATIFVNPEFVDEQNGVRPNLGDYWSGSASWEELNQWGYLSWEEMRIMEQSGWVDIQSHTMTHTKYFVSDKLTGFHHPGADALYPIGNLFKEKKPDHIANREFEKLLPYGFPFFEEASSVIARKVEINPAFSAACVKALANYGFGQYRFEQAWQIVQPVYREFQAKGELVLSRETDAAYLERVAYEVAESKRLIEAKLAKKVEFLCWPHGDNNELAHQMALEAGYLATTVGSKQQVADSPERIPIRVGLYHVRHNRLLSKLKARYKIGLHLGRSPWKELNQLYRFTR